MNRIAAILIALTFAACSSVSYTTDDAFCMEIAPPGGPITLRPECPAREGFYRVASCDGNAVIINGLTSPLARHDQRITCDFREPPACPQGGTPQCTYVSTDLDWTAQTNRAGEVCRDAGYAGVGICYVDAVTLELVEFDPDYAP